MNTFDRLGETYEILGQIDSGGGGTIYKARHKRLDKYVVIKKIHTEVMHIIDSSAEANILKNLRHSYLPQVLDILTIDGNVFTIMDFIPGKNFQKLLDEGTRFTQKQVIKWARQLAEALEYLHRQNPPIIHSDIKPANIMLTPNDDICLIDFNISSIFSGKGAKTVGFSDGYSPPEQYRIYEELSLGNAQTVATYVGEENNSNAQSMNLSGRKTIPLNYNSMNQAENRKTLLLGAKALQEAAAALEPNSHSMPSQYVLVNEKSDIYSFGATLYHMLTGVRPQKATEPVTQITSYGIKISDGLVYVITKAMQKNPTKRFSNAAQLLKTLTKLGKLDRRYKRFMRMQELTYILMLLLLSGSILTVHYGRLKIHEENQEKYDYLIEQLEEDRINSDYEAMEEYYQEAVELIPNRIEAYYQKAIALFEQRKYGEASEYIEEIIVSNHTLEQSQKMEDLYFILANCYFELEDYEKAITNFRSVLALSKDNPEYYRDFAISLARIGNTDKARETLEEAIDMGIAGDSIYLIKGEINLYDEDFEEAKYNLSECIRTTENDYIRMRAYLKFGELYDAMTLKTDDREHLGDILLEKSKILLEAKEALPLDMTVGITERLIQTYIDCGTIFNQNAYYIQAITESKHLISLGLDTYHTHNNMVILYQKTGAVEEAMEEAHKMITQYGEDYNIYKRLSYLVLDMQNKVGNKDRNYSEFLHYYDKAIALYEKESDQNRTDVEMIRLQELYEDLVKGGWFE